jgi:hypothetical protein
MKQTKRIPRFSIVSEMPQNINFPAWDGDDLSAAHVKRIQCKARDCFVSVKETATDTLVYEA